MSLIAIVETVLIGPLKLFFEFAFSIANRVLGHNPGMAIIFLSLAMNVLVLPLYRRADVIQEEARDKEARLRDGVAHIKKTFSGDERMMILQTYYRQNDYKPTSALSGSVSLLLEIPFFMAAYQFLSQLPILQGASFGPIADLGAPDGMLIIGGLAINLLPILMTLINILSGAIYSKGFPLKTKIQMYGLAGLFLVVLYNSPSGLVFYWTLNNVFSLFKNIVTKVKFVREKGGYLLFGAGAALAVYGLLFYQTVSFKRKLFVVAVGIVLMLPLLWAWVRKRNIIPTIKNKAQPNNKIFALACLFAAVLTGVLIPSTYISASTLEFVEQRMYYDPMLYILSSACMAAGTFLVWVRVFYWLANDQGKVVFGYALWTLCGMMLVNYMFFGTDLGIISSHLQYENGLSFTSSETMVNMGVMVLVTIVMCVILAKWPRPAMTVLLTVILAVGGMSAVNMMGIHNDTSDYLKRTNGGELDKPEFQLSKSGENVVVIMLDRAMGELVPYLLQEKPELKEQFAGFTYYSNTMSFGIVTNFASPGLYGGYEYTPVELNLRDSELLKDKQNEALKVMPVLFLENGFDITVFDPTYANYSWIPDLSIYSDYPEIKAYNAESYYTGDERLQNRIVRRSRNFFCFGLMKTLPVILQETIYCEGTYNRLTVNNDDFLHYDGFSISTGIPSALYPAYNELSKMQEMTIITEENKNTFLMMSNHTTHEPSYLQTPDYTLTNYVDNTEYDMANQDRFTLNGATLKISDYFTMGHYHVNMAVLLRLGEWFDYLRTNGVYDNTRIILVADHGKPLNLLEELVLDDGGGGTLDVAGYYPLLMVKDFNAKEFTISDAFMTNAYVPTMAMENLIPDPVNPFTGKAITNSEKTAHRQYIIVSTIWDTEINNGNTFMPAKWASVKDNIWDPENWEFYNEEIVLKEHAFPS